VVNVKLKLALLWIVLMWFYAYNDIMSFFRQDMVEGILAGNIEGITFTQPFMFAMALLMSFPIFMILLSVMLPARLNRGVNIGAGIFHLVLLGITATVGDEGPWAYYALYMAFEGVIIALITWTAWKWPTTDGVPHGAPRATGVELGI
ncbi:MAG: hypothetical protein GWN39_00155, partial [Thermoplasmata archaeon]|nr:hypothetical protein [Thermoplasmata archaeon]NIS10379.1 hypothetical protein [Thermoplasmata archaeon]NIV77180.1 hypothetical protein [Thermoplasmata archaeon]NIW87213.1 hypothetical protein [Thermoplasmata archaeon]